MIRPEPDMPDLPWHAAQRAQVFPGHSSRSPSLEGRIRARCFGRSSGSGFILGRAPSHDSVSQWLVLSVVLPYSGGAAPEFHRVPFLHAYTGRDQALFARANIAGLSGIGNAILRGGVGEIIFRAL
jgi:hypothetical protein